MMLVVTSMVMAYLLLRSFWGRTAVMLLALPLSVAKNSLRVFTLAAIAAYWDPAILNSRLHHQGGILFFAIGLASVLGAIWLVAQLEGRQMRRKQCPADCSLAQFKFAVAPTPTRVGWDGRLHEYIDIKLNDSAVQEMRS